MLPDHAQQLAQARRSTLVLFALAVLLPAGCNVPLARQARKLEALAVEGVPVDATVTQIDAQRTVHLRYMLGESTHTWSVRSDEAPGARVGGVVPVAVLPSHPSTLVVGDRSNALAKAAAGRAFAWKLDLGLLWFFGFAGVLSAWQYERMRRTGRTERDDPTGYRARLMLTGVWMAPIVLAIFVHHARDAAAKGEPAWLVPLAGVFALGVLGGTVAFVLREGRTKAAERAATLAKWAFPLALAVGVARLLLWLVVGSG